jgi:hypothetical protein
MKWEPEKGISGMDRFIVTTNRANMEEKYAI